MFGIRGGFDALIVRTTVVILPGSVFPFAELILALPIG